MSPLLEALDLHKSFGGVVATDGVTFEVSPGETRAIIGPNGAGKTTLLSELSGFVFPDLGLIRFRGRDITRWHPYRRARLGLARSFQITNVFSEMTALENVALAVQANEPHAFRFWRPAQSDPRLVEPASELLERMSLRDQAQAAAGSLSHGQRRRLELAMVLASDPKLLLLDEPMAGMGPDEAAAMLRVLGDVKREKTLLLIEHDLDAVFALADRITVLVSGCIIASDTPDRVRADPEVRRAYLGDELEEERETPEHPPTSATEAPPDA